MGSYKEDTITVRAKSDTPRTRDDWLINLVIDAGITVSEKHDVDLHSIQLKLLQVRLQ